MALCCAYDFKATTQLPISGVITFGQPKLADSPLAKHLNVILAKKYLAVVADEDPVADTVPLCNFCGNSVWFYGGRAPRYDGESDKALMSSSPGSENTSAEQADEPFFEEVMTEEELRRKQEMLREQDEPPIRNPNDPPVAMSSLPFFRDHNMTNYIDKLRNFFSGNGR